MRASVIKKAIKSIYNPWGRFLPIPVTGYLALSKGAKYYRNNA
jgi:hypothetical protein